MSNAISFAPREAAELDTLEDKRRKVVHELEIYGYKKASQDFEGRLLYRSPTGPDLLILENGRLELIVSDQSTRSAFSAPLSQSKVRWDRTLLILATVGVITFLGLILIAMIVG